MSDKILNQVFFSFHLVLTFLLGTLVFSAYSRNDMRSVVVWSFMLIANTGFMICLGYEWQSEAEKEKKVDTDIEIHYARPNKMFNEILEIKFEVVDNIEFVEDIELVEDLEYLGDTKTIELNSTFNYMNIQLENNTNGPLMNTYIRLTNPKTKKTNIIIEHRNIFQDEEIKLLNETIYEDGQYFLGVTFKHNVNNYFILLTLKYESFKDKGMPDDNTWIIEQIKHFVRINGKHVEIKGLAEEPEQCQ